MCHKDIKQRTKNISLIGALLLIVVATLVVCLCRTQTELAVVEKPKTKVKSSSTGEQKSIPKVSTKPVTSPETTKVQQKVRLSDMPENQRDLFVAKKIAENLPTASTSSNRTFRTGVEQVASWIFTTRIGDTPPPLPRISIRDEAHLREILSTPNDVSENDSEKIIDAKQTVEAVKQLMEAYLNKGGRAQEFFEYYHSQLKEAHDVWRDHQVTLMKALKEDPDTASIIYKELSEDLTSKGIKPLMVPPKFWIQLGLEKE